MLMILYFNDLKNLKIEKKIYWGEYSILLLLYNACI